MTDKEQLEWLWKNCRIIYREDMEYPINHDPGHSDMRWLIEAAMMSGMDKQKDNRVDNRGDNHEDNDWIEWNGGECPVDAETIVSLKCREFPVLIARKAKNIRWHHDGKFDDIVAYKLEKSQ